VTVVAKRIGSRISIGRSSQAENHLVIPAKSTIKPRATNGQIIVDGVTGDGDLETSNGKITILNTNGAYTSSTSNG